jgi:integrase
VPWITRLPPRKSDGKALWSATVRTGPGPKDRVRKSHELRSVVVAWAAEMETDLRRGEFIDPRAGEVTVGEWHERCKGSRHLEKASRKRDESHWRNHVGPRWAHVSVGSILKPDVSTWIVEMQEAGVGPWTVDGALKVLRGLMEQAVEAKLRRDNPAARVKKAPPDAHVDRLLDNDEERQLLGRLGELFGDRVDALLFVELLLDTGMRWEEGAALPPEMVDTKRQRIHVAWVMERDGTARPYAKSDAGNRVVPYGDHLAARVAAAKLAAPPVPGVFPVPRRGQSVPGRLVFYSPGGGGTAKRKRGEPGPLRYSNWHRQVWTPALCVEVPGAPVGRVAGRPGPAPRAVRRERYLPDPQPTPHDLRHTYGTRLADEGVPQHEIMALLGHKDPRAVQRYLHAREERFDRARRALDRARRGTSRESSVSRDLETRPNALDGTDRVHRGR